MTHHPIAAQTETNHVLSWDELDAHIPGGLKSIVDMLAMMGFASSGLGPILAIAARRPSMTVRVVIQGEGSYVLTIS